MLQHWRGLEGQNKRVDTDVHPGHGRMALLIVKYANLLSCCFNAHVMLLMTHVMPQVMTPNCEAEPLSPRWSLATPAPLRRVCFPFRFPSPQSQTPMSWTICLPW